MSNSGKVKCTCGWSWNKSDSSKKDMYICHECGRDNSNNMKNGGWLDNYNDSEVSLPKGYVGEGYSTKGRNYSPAWGGQFQMGGEVPKRRGVRQNPDGTVSTHLMATETDGKGNWFSFPTLFQNSIPYADDSENWLDMSDRPWEEAYEEAKKRGEVINFGSDKDAAIKFGQGSWKDKKQMGGYVYPVNYVPKAQDGNIIPSDLPDPVNGIIYDPEGERTYYDDRLDRIVLTPSSNFAPRQSVINHEKFHKYQFDNLLSNYDIAHREAVPLFKKPSMVSTDEEYYKFHDRKGREAKQDIKNVKSNYPEFTFVPNQVLFDKIIDREQYSNPFTLEGEAQAYENSLNKFQMGGSIPGAVGFTYARTINPAPSNGKYAKKTKASAQNGKWLGNKLNKQGYITSETKGGNRISFTGNQRVDEWINKQIDSGKFGFDPKTGATFPLKKPVKGLSKEDQFIGTKQYHDLQAPQGFNTEDQLAQIKKLPEWQQDIINSSNQERRKRVVKDQMDKVYKNPLWYAPGAIALAPIATAGLTEAGMLAAPYIEAVSATQLPGMATVPGATVGNAVTAGFAGHGLANVGPDTVEFIKNPTLENAGAVGMDAVEIAPIVGPGAKVIGEGVNYAKNVAPKINNFSRTAVNDVNDTFRYFKGKQMSKGFARRAIGRDLEYLRAPFTKDMVSSPMDFENYYEATMRNLHDLYSIGNPANSNARAFKLRMDQQFGEELDAIRSGQITDPERLTKILNNIKLNLPGEKEITKDVISSINQSQRNLIFNPDTDPGLIKNYFKNLKNLEGKETNFSLTPKEKETLDAMRELGKYKSEAYNNLTRLLHDSDAMSGINKAISNLDDDVVKSVIGIPKSDLLSSYQRNVPLDVRSKATDLMSNPIPTNQVMNLQQENLLNDPFVTKSITPSYSSRSLLQKFGDNYVKNFSKYDIEPFQNTPNSLIGSARTDYKFVTPEVVDAEGNIIGFGKPYFDRSNRTVGQLKEALKKVEAGNKGDTFIGSGSLSADSYPLTLDSGLFMMNRGAVSPGFTGKFNVLNDWGYANQAPNLVLKDVNSKILELEKLSGKKFPKATYTPEQKLYNVPELYFTKLKQGGVIKDDLGQWAHPGEITEIGSNNITMEGVPYDVLGISDTGDTKLMKPGKNYKFKGKKVTEFPMAKNGLRQEQKGLVNLDQLTNFTNYNTKQPGGWLDKY